MILLKSQNNGGALAISLGQHDADGSCAVFAGDASKPVARNVLTISR